MVKGIKKIGSGIWDRKRNITLTVLVIIFLAIALNIFVFYRTKNPVFCLKCHYMKPYYEQWETSSHKNVSCMKCLEYNSFKMLVSTIKYYANSYNRKPNSESPSSNCLQSGCHERRMLPG